MSRHGHSHGHSHGRSHSRSHSHSALQQRYFTLGGLLHPRPHRFGLIDRSSTSLRPPVRDPIRDLGGDRVIDPGPGPTPAWAIGSSSAKPRPLVW
ncbi:MAG: hypothetical protein HC824_07205 [Synechococcales cyanobacterium RM1_1_8]|nr:hypothetical protein [Synechococcales cyanobacterium RM1_1_8]